MKCMHRCFLTDRSVCIIVLDGREDATIDHDVIRWIDTINTFSSNVPVIIVINKIDIYANASLRETELKQNYPQIVDIFKTSALTSEGLSDLKKCLIETVSKTDCFKPQYNPKLKELMNSVEKSDKPYILSENFDELCQKIGIEDRYGYLNLLNYLGILHYYKVESGEEHQVYHEKYTILKPDWLTNGIYRIINRMPANTGFIMYTDLYEMMAKQFENDVLPDTTYNEQEVGYILYVMRKFNLSYKADSHREFIPINLPKDSPAIVSRLKSSDCLHVSWECKSMIPLNVLYRVMIDKYGQLRLDSIWKYGAVFKTKDNKSSALVEIDIDEKSINIYVISDCGKANEYLSEYRNAIYEALKEIKADEIIHHWSDEKGKEGRIPYDTVMAHKRKIRRKFMTALSIFS